ncbi:MAG: ImmA/IrrE family metallo-endopeptidase [Terricaulis sp.]|nr:ImmA/IrrE family metallo-endopeptidase [Terricaulis sp.]
MQSNAEGINDDDIEIISSLVENFERANIRIDAPSPVDAIKFRMEELNLTPRDLEPYIGSRARVSEILGEKRSLSIDMIRSLHEGLGIPYESLLQERTKPRSSSPEFSKPALQKLRLLGFDLTQESAPLFIESSMQRALPFALHRKTLTQRAASKTDLAALDLWQAAVIKRAATIVHDRPFQRAALTSTFLRDLARMSAQALGPRKAIQALHDVGVSVALVPAIPGTFLDGAAMLDQAERPVVALTLRYDRTDSFWFTLLHECAHVRLHYDRLKTDVAAFIDDIDINSDELHEREADDLARVSLIPDNILKDVTWSQYSTAADIYAVASRARVNVAVAAGRWQRDYRNYRKFSRLIERGNIREMLEV